MDKTKIEWAKNPDGTQGYTWNVITGCLNGCEYCYARKLAQGRLKSLYLANKNVAKWHEPTLGEYGFKALGRVLTDPFYPRFWENRLYDPSLQRFKRPDKSYGIFVCDMGELFGDWIPTEWQEKIFQIIKLNPWHRFYLLSHQPQNLIKFSPFPGNCWVGVTATNREEFTLACTHLIGIEARVKFISLEPLLQRILLLEFGEWGKEPFDWVIIGAQTKPYKPPQQGWVEEIVRDADKVGVPVFLKDNLLEMVNYQSPETDFAFNKEGYYRQEMPEG